VPRSALKPHRKDGMDMFSATQIADFLACHHLTTLERCAAAGEIKKPFFADPGVDLLRALGIRHEQAFLANLRARRLEVAEIPTEAAAWNEAAERTVEAVRQGAEAVYQATFLNGVWGGRADFLLKVSEPSALGDWSYEVIETKLARSTKARAVIQLCFYSDLLAQIQEGEPRNMHVVLGGTSEPEPLPVSHYLAYFRKVRSEFEEAWRAAEPTYPEPVEQCEVCSWFPVCDDRWRQDDHLSLVAGITRNQRKVLTQRKVSTVASLARLPLPARPRIEGIGETALVRIREQARLQVEGREKARLVYELLTPVEAERGLAALPEPCAGDLFLDFEGDPYAFNQEGLEYLIGTAAIEGERGSGATYQPRWSFDRASEKQAFERFIASVMERRKRYPDMHIYHYAPYEPTAIKCLAGRHGTRVDEVDQLLRSGAFVDLYRVVRQGLRASVESYSIKHLEPLYGFARTLPLRDATLALQTLETVMALGDAKTAPQGILKTIEAYNRDDCLSALHLREWLEARRRQLEAASGRVLPRPAPREDEPSEELAEHLAQVHTVMERLLAGVPDDETDRTAEDQARWLLAQMLEWHRREEKSSWWEYFRMCDLSDDEVLEDKKAMGGLVYEGQAGREKRSIIHRYRFPPQEYAIDQARAVHDPKTQKSAGQLAGIDERKGYVYLKRAATSQVPHPTALIPYDTIDTQALRGSLLRLGSWVADHRIDAPGKFRAARDLLLRRAPRLRGTTLRLLAEGNQGPVQIARRAAVTLKDSVLPIQGPPGSGKTYTAARMAVELVNSGCRVGITAVSHKVITKLLEDTCTAAREAGVALRIIQKAGGDEDHGCQDAMVTVSGDNEEVREALANGDAQVAAGTAWLWSRENMAGSVDVLLVDEAGQMSLANALALSQAAGSLVLIGDPQQLDQPRKGVHPPGCDLSALAHLLGARATIGPDEGLFLAETRRLHPDVCAFISELFYDARLRPRRENQNQRLNCQGLLDGTGLRYCPVVHTGNQNESTEEVRRVAGLFGVLLRKKVTWTDKQRRAHRLELEDILVVAPYNAQVSALAEVLPAGARVGTVDKFQGQEAPVVIYSMATSTPEDAPRGMEFLYSLNRLNVAVSRARCVAVIVASPTLFQVQCRTPRQIELVNAFCRYLEIARRI
jgi:predicted RecB family nuclease